MIKVDNIKVFNFEGALRGLRNPMNSWAKSDSKFENLNLLDDFSEDCREVTNKWVEKHQMDKDEVYEWLMRNGYVKELDAYTFIGPNDMDLAQRMVLAGADEGKFMRQIFVSMDIEAPLYWWKEMDTYKVATVSNSTSTMHKLTSQPFTKDMFSIDDGAEFVILTYELIPRLENLRKRYLESKDKRIWRALVQILPSGFNQKRTWTANYQVLRNIYFQRRHHKLQEWKDFCKVIESFPYGKDLITIERDK